MSNQRFTAANGSLIALADCDTFYASCERISRPDLIGKPIVVLSNNDGCLVSLSREAKALGLITFGEPYFKQRKILERLGVTVFSSNYTLYGDISTRVMQTLQSIVPRVEVYSIDEAFLHFTGALALQPDMVAMECRNRVLQWVGAPISIGIAPTKVLAKIATKLAKKSASGIFDMSALSPAEIDRILADYEIGELWGIGRQARKKLLALGISRAIQLRDADASMIKRMLTVAGHNLQMELRGIPAIREEIALTHHAIISSRSLGFKVRDLARMSEAIAFHTSCAAEKLRRKRLVCGCVGVRIQTAYYDTSQPMHDEARYVGLVRPTADTSKLIGVAERVLEKIFQPDRGYAKAMVLLLDLRDERKGQHDMLALEQDVAAADAKSRAVMTIMDKINRLEGRGTIHFAAQGLGKRDWHMNRNNLSPCWTTDVRELLHAS